MGFDSCAERSWGSMMRVENLIRMGVLWTFAVLSSYFKLLYDRTIGQPVNLSRSQEFSMASRSSIPIIGQKKRLMCIVTGASSGIGKATVEALAAHGYLVVLAGPCLYRLSQVSGPLTEKYGKVSVEARELNLCSRKSILRFTDSVKRTLQDSGGSIVLQLLVNNAGIISNSRDYNDCGFDRTMTTNYLGHYLLTQRLLPLFSRDSPQARIVNVTSFAHRCVKAAVIDAGNLVEGSLGNFSLNTSWYNTAKVYENSKCMGGSTVCLLLFTYELHRLLYASSEGSKISVMAADPGIVRTNILRRLPESLVSLTFFVLKCLTLLQDPVDGARAVVDAALAPEGESGKYFFGGRGGVISSSPQSYDKTLSEDLWRVSASICEEGVQPWWGSCLRPFQFQDVIPITNE